MKKIIFTLSLLLLALAAVAQNKNTVSGTLVTEDKEEGLTGVVGATIELTLLSDTLQKKYTITAIRGAYQFKAVPPGKYQLKAESMGYKTAIQEINVATNKGLVVPEWKIEEDAQRIDMVSVTTQAVRTSINGDTIAYNAEAFKVLPDADVDELLAKMPGIRVEGGTIEAQGETVKKILVDGREMFGDDVSTAVKALPASAVKSVEVFDKLSDEAEFSGIDDGNSYKAINLVTYEKMKISITGKINGMYAFEPKDHDKTQHYGSGNANINFFRDGSRLTVSGGGNNMAGNSDSKTWNAGVNYTDAWGENDKIRLDANYRYSGSNRKNWSWTDRDYFLTDEEVATGADDIYQRYTSNSNNGSTSGNHNIGSRLEYRISERQRLMMRIGFGISDSDSKNGSNSYYFPVSGIDSIGLHNWGLSESGSWNTNINGNYMLRIGEKAGRMINVNFGANFSDNNSDGENYSEKIVNKAVDPVQQLSVSDSYNYGLNGGLTYAEPIGSHAQATVNYEANYRYSDGDRQTNLYDFINGNYATEISPEYSNKSNTDYFTQRVGPGFRFSNEGTSLSGRFNYQNVRMNSERIYPAEWVLPGKTFHNFTYSVNARLKLNMENRITARVSSSTSNPSVNQLQDVVDISNVNNIRSGNPHLKPTYTHRMSVGYIHSGVAKGTTFAINLSGNKSSKVIVDSVVMNQPGFEVYSPDGEFLTTLSSTGRYSKPVNMEGDWSYNGRISYGFPVIGCNLNLSADGSFSQSPSILNGVVNESKRYTAGGSISLGSNFSEYVDFHFSYHPTYSNVRNSMSTNGNNEYLQHRANGNIRVVFGFGLTLHLNGNYSQYVGISENAKRQNHTEYVCNAGLGWKVLKKMGEVQLVANDIFNKETGYNRSWNSLYMQSSMSSVIGRYFGVKFTYNLQNYMGGNTSRNTSNVGENGSGFRGGMSGGISGGMRGGMGGGMRGGGF